MVFEIIVDGNVRSIGIERRMMGVVQLPRGDLQSEMPSRPCHPSAGATRRYFFDNDISPCSSNELEQQEIEIHTSAGNKHD